MHRINKSKNDVPTFRQGNIDSYKDREVFNRHQEILLRHDIDFSRQMESINRIDTFLSETFSETVDELTDFLFGSPPTVSPESMDRTAENISMLTRTNLATVESGIKLFMEVLKAGPIYSNTTPVGLALDLMLPSPMADMTKSYFRNVADPALFRGNVDIMRYQRYTFNTNISNNPFLQDFGPTADIFLDPYEATLGRRRGEYVETEIGIDGTSIDEKENTSNNYENLFQTENYNQRGHYADGMMDRYNEADNDHDSNDTSGENDDWDDWDDDWDDWDDWGDLS